MAPNVRYIILFRFIQFKFSISIYIHKITGEREKNYLIPTTRQQVSKLTGNIQFIAYVDESQISITKIIYSIILDHSDIYVKCLCAYLYVMVNALRVCI